MSHDGRNKGGVSLTNVGQGPCQDCPRWWDCKRERLACAAFRAYVMGYRHKGTSRAPSKKMYLKIFNQTED